MQYQTIKENGKTKFVVLPVKVFESILERLEDESDIRAIHEPGRSNYTIRRKPKITSS